MFLDLQVGSITEPLTGRRWDRLTIMSRCYERIAYFEERGMRGSDRVFIQYGNNIEFFVDLISIWSLGGCIIPVDPRLTIFEVETLARAAHPRFSLWDGAPDDAMLKALSSLGVQVLTSSDSPITGSSITLSRNIGNNFTLDQEALILFTSGTTGSPKGVVHTHRSLLARWMSLRQSLGLAAYERTLCLLPTHFGHGLICNCLFPWLSGLDLYILPPFKPEIIMQLGEILDKHGITFMSSVPTVWRLALKTARPPQSRKLKRVFCGSAPLSGFLWESIKEWTGAEEVFNAYGITETGSWLAGTTVVKSAPEDGLIGEAWGGVVKVLKCSDTKDFPTAAHECEPGNSGFVWVNTPALMKGYLENEEMTRKVVSQGWFFTGDIGYLDERGFLYLRGRVREEINKGGMKVYPGDIDAVIERFKETLDVCTFGYEDTLLGENIGVAVVLKSKNDDIIRDLYDWTNHHLAKHQMPVRWYVIDEIPRSSRGKINRTDVAQKCTGLVAVDPRLFKRDG